MEDEVVEKEKEAAAGELPSPQLSPALVRDSVIVLDWDDTILPTSWLDKIRALTAGVPLRPEVQRQMANLCAVCTTTMSMAAQMGNLIFITNSAPGWVDQSCQLFMPQIYQQVRALKIFAKPWQAPITFKLGAFRRECQAFRNLVSVGDGDAERAASLRLLTPPDRNRSAEANRCVKSVKLIEFPSCQQLIAQHEMLQVRLLDIVAFQGSLDLKARFAGAMGFGGAGNQGKGNGCTLVHFPRGPGCGQMSPPPRAAQSACNPLRPPMQEDSGTSASSKMSQSLLLMKLPPGLRTPAHGLPPLSGPGAVGSRSGCDTAPSSPGHHDSLCGLATRPSASSELHRSPGGSGPADFLSDAAEANSGKALEDLPGGTWRMQSIPRSQYNTPTKKRPVLGSTQNSPLSGMRGGRAAGGGAVWREASAPAASRGSSSLG